MITNQLLYQLSYTGSGSNIRETEILAKPPDIGKFNRPWK
jgi:hypothetical protein